MSGLLESATARVLLLVLAGVAAAAVAYHSLKLWDLSGQVRAAESQRDGALAKLGACRAGLADLDAAIGRQNAATVAYKADVERRLAEAQADVERARRAAQKAKGKAGAVLAAKPGADLCASLDRLMLESVR